MTARYISRLAAFLLLLSVLTSALGCGSAPVPDGGDVIGLMYHNLSENPDEISAWTTSPAALRANLTELTQLGYYPLSLEAYIAGDYEPTRNYFVLTFDDGYESNLTLALPILRELYVPATVFVVTDLMGQPDYLSWEQVQALQDSGLVSVYSHTHTHMNAREIPADTFLADVQVSAEMLTAHLGEPAHRILCYPYGAATDETARALLSDGYDMIVLQEKPGWYTTENHPRLLIRMNVDGGYTDMLHLLNSHRRHVGLPKLP